MQFYYSAILIFQYISWIGIRQVCSIPLNQTELVLDEAEESLAENYANLKYDLIHNMGYSLEFADMVEINLKRAVREERVRQRQEGISSSQKPNFQRQGNQGAEDYEYDESTLAPVPTTPGASVGDVVRGIAGIITSLGTFNPGNLISSFVNFFPPSQREAAQAIVDSSLGRRPAKWPTLPTTTTKLTTTTKDEFDIYSEETTLKSAVTAAPAGATATTVSPGTATGAPATVNVRQATEAGTRAPTTKYTVQRRTTALPNDGDDGVEMTVAVVNTNNGALKVSGSTLDEDDEIELLSAPSSSTTGPTS